MIGWKNLKPHEMSFMVRNIFPFSQDFLNHQKYVFDNFSLVSILQTEKNKRLNNFECMISISNIDENKLSAKSKELLINELNFLNEEEIGIFIEDIKNNIEDKNRIISKMSYEKINELLEYEKILVTLYFLQEENKEKIIELFRNTDVLTVSQCIKEILKDLIFGDKINLLMDLINEKVIDKEIIHNYIAFIDITYLNENVLYQKFKCVLNLDMNLEKKAMIKKI